MVLDEPMPPPALHRCKACGYEHRGMETVGAWEFGSRLRNLAIVAGLTLVGCLVVAALPDAQIGGLLRRLLVAGALGAFSCTVLYGVSALFHSRPRTWTSRCPSCGAEGSVALTADDMRARDVATAQREIDRLASADHEKRTRRFYVVAPLVIAGVIAAMVALKAIIG